MSGPRNIHTRDAESCYERGADDPVAPDAIEPVPGIIPGKHILPHDIRATTTPTDETDAGDDPTEPIKPAEPVNGETNRVSEIHYASDTDETDPTATEPTTDRTGTHKHNDTAPRQSAHQPDTTDKGTAATVVGDDTNTTPRTTTA